MDAPRTPPRSGRRPAAVLLAGVGLLGALLSGCGDDGEVDGRALFAANCAVCHGTAGEGGAGAPPLTDPAYLPDQLSDAEVAAAIRGGVRDVREGYGAMPAFSNLTEEQIAALVEVVRELQGS